MAVLDTIQQDDQKYLIAADELVNKHGWQSEEVQDK